MKNFSTPSRDELVEVYDFLQHVIERHEELRDFPQALPRYAMWSRLDPRLGEILTLTLAKYFRKIDPVATWDHNRHSPEPAVLGVILDFATEAAPASERDAFIAWKRAVLSDVRPAAFQMFFISQGSPKPQALLNEIAKNLKVYSAWGFAGEDSLLPSKIAKQSTLTLRQRRLILENLFETNKTLTVKDYIAACTGRVSRRNAERDLASHPRLRANGFTRNRIYEVTRDPKQNPRT